jgi:hypothetical protein
MQKNNKGKRKDQAKPETGSEKKQKQKERGVSAQRHRLIQCVKGLITLIKLID